VVSLGRGRPAPPDRKVILVLKGPLPRLENLTRRKKIRGDSTLQPIERKGGRRKIASLHPITLLQEEGKGKNLHFLFAIFRCRKRKPGQISHQALFKNHLGRKGGGGLLTMHLAEHLGRGRAIEFLSSLTPLVGEVLLGGGGKKGGGKRGEIHVTCL